MLSYLKLHLGITQFQEVISQLKMRLDSAYQELYGQPDIPSVASKTNQPAVEIEVDSKSGAVSRVSESRPQQLSRVMLQPCLSLTMSTAQQNVRGAHASCIV